MSPHSESLTPTSRRVGLTALLRALVLVGVCTNVLAGSPQKTYASPEEAAQALADALSTNDTQLAEAVLGPKGEKLLNSGDPVADDRAWLKFLGAFAKAHKIEQEGNQRAVLHVGEEDWPFPIPIVRKGKVWLFDTPAGANEILNRRIGRNELNAIQVCLAIVDAQREYASVERDGSGVRAFARRFLSVPGKKDGLYWSTQQGEEPSPLGPLVAHAAEEGYPTSKVAGKPVPYHGYFYRILTRQGGNANGGAYDYLIDGRMLGGFALVAYPDRYRVSGVMTFIVNQDGVVYEKDLGRYTGKVAKDVAAFDPDRSWRKTSTSFVSTR